MNNRSTIIEDIINSIKLEDSMATTIDSYFQMHFGGSLFIPCDENGDGDPQAEANAERCSELARPLIEAVIKKLRAYGVNEVTKRDVLSNDKSE